jgi:hypothetical protein
MDPVTSRFETPRLDRALKRKVRPARDEAQV